MYYHLRSWIDICSNPVNFQEHLAQVASEKEGVSEKTEIILELLGLL